MACAVCLQTDNNSTNLYNDCIIEYLEKIRLHYIHLKIQLDDKDYTVKQLRATNKDLTTRLETVSTSCKSSPKRRKTNSFEDSQLSIKSPTDHLNEAIKCELSLDESFFISTQQEKQIINPNNILQPSNNSPDRNTPSSHSMQVRANVALPQRLSLHKTPLSVVSKAQTSVQAIIVRNPGTENCNPKWSSKETIKGNKLKNREYNMSFLQPPQPRRKNITPLKKNVAPQSRTITPRKKPESPAEKEASPGSINNRLGLKTEANLKQTRLKFELKRDEPTIRDSDETFCDDLITPSPTSLATAADETGKPRQRTIRKLGRTKLQLTTSIRRRDSKHSIKNKPLPSVKKVLNLDAKPNEGNQSSISLHQIKNEPLSTIKKVQDFDAKPNEHKEQSSPSPRDESITLSGIQPHSDNSSLCILPSKQDDIILVEETNTGYDVNIDSDALFNEIMAKSDETSPFLKNIEDRCIQNLKNMQDKINETTKTAPCDKSKIIPKWNCADCERFFGGAGRRLTDEELVKRMEHCKTHHRRRQETPEGFWNPCFLPTQEDDPRYQTLLDTRFVRKKI